MKERLARKLRRQKRAPLTLSGYASCAVLVPLFAKRGRYHLLYTLRSRQVRDHKSQISFPGGVREKGDRNLRETALRETREEIGLDPKKVEILGILDEILTPTGYRITPYLGLVEYPFALRVSRKEIRRLIEVPLDHLLNPRYFRSERAEFFDRRFDYPFFQYRGHLIWGATGRITKNLLEVFRRIASREPAKKRY